MNIKLDLYLVIDFCVIWQLILALLTRDLKLFVFLDFTLPVISAADSCLVLRVDWQFSWQLFGKAVLQLTFTSKNK